MTVTAGVVAGLLTAAALPVWRRLAPRSGFLDHPTARSLHASPVPRAAGAVMLLAAGLAFGWLGPGWPDATPARAVLAAVALVAMAGLADDRFGLPVAVRLAAHVAAAAIVVVGGGVLTRLPLPPPLDLPLGALGVPLTLLWIVALTNFYNFMDGIDGLAALQGLATGAAIAAAAWDPTAAALGAVLAGTCVGLLPFNWAPARVFMGDVASGALGLAFASAPLLAPEEARPGAVLLVAVSLGLFLLDPAVTLVRRAARGRSLWAAHREHLYQRLVLSGLGHAPVTALVGSAGVVLTLAALLGWFRGGRAAWWGPAASLLAFVLLWVLVQWRESPARARAARR